MSENEGQIDNLEAFQHQFFWDVPIWMCSDSASSLLSEATIIEIESDPIFHAEQHMEWKISKAHRTERRKSMFFRPMFLKCIGC